MSRPDLKAARAARGAPFLTATVFDPISARLAARHGVGVGALAGSVASHQLLGAPDDLTITLTELADLARRICAVRALPLIVDADHGYGGLGGVKRTVAALDGAGAAGMSLEDSLLPHPFGATTPRYVSVAEAQAKIETALDARRNDDFAIFARANLKGRRLDDAAPVLDAYARIACDGVFLSGVADEGEARRALARWDGPFIFSGLPAESRRTLNDPKIFALYQPHTPYAAMIAALDRALGAQAAGEDPPDGPAADALLKSLLA